MTTAAPRFRTVVASAFAAALILAASPARAQYADPPPPPPGYGPPPPAPAQPVPDGIYRSGWYLGLAIGGGGINGEGGGESLDAFLADLHFGGMVTPQLGLQVELRAAIHDYADYDNSALVLSNAGIAAQYWATPKLWLKVGLGSASMDFQMDGETVSSVDGTSFLAGIGYELLQRGQMAIDVQLTTTATSYRDGYGNTNTTGIEVGFNWY